METEDNENLDLAAEYSPKSDFSKAEVVKMQVTRCNEARSKEMREGYFNYDKEGNKIYVPDSRKEFISSVKALRNLLMPEIRRDKKYKEKEKNILQKEKDIIKKLGIHPIIIDNGIIKDDIKQNKYIPQIDEVFPVKITIMNRHHQKSVGNKIKYVPGIYNRIHHNYWDYLVELYDKLYAALNELIDRCNYFKQQISY